jgi:hypothetical protein
MVVIVNWGGGNDSGQKGPKSGSCLEWPTGDNYQGRLL